MAREKCGHLAFPRSIRLQLYREPPLPVGHLTACRAYVGQKKPENVAQLRAHVVKLCRALSEDLCRKVMTNARVRLQEVLRQNGGHIEYVLH